MDYTKIYRLLDENNSKVCQNIGLDLARKIKDIRKLILPMHPIYNKNIWNNCAQIISEKSDQELKEYLKELFVWLQDLTWPGSIIILERLKKFDAEVLVPIYIKTIEDILEQEYQCEGWLENLSILIVSEQIANNLPAELYQKLKKAYNAYFCED